MYMLYAHCIFVLYVYSNFQYTSYFFLFAKKRTKGTKSKLELSAVRVLALGGVRSIVRKNPKEKCPVVSCE